MIEKILIKHTEHFILQVEATDSTIDDVQGGG